MYRILPFVISEFEDKQVIQNCKATIIIKNRKISDFFLKAETQNKNVYLMEEIQSIFGNETDSILKFLMDNKLMIDVAETSMFYKGVKFISNDDVFISSIDFNSKGNEYDVVAEKLESTEYPVISLNPDFLHVVFLNPFNYSAMLKINEQLNSSNVIYRIAFYYQHRIYVSNYHKNDWHNPCPVCFYANIESNLRGQSKTMNTVSFQTMLDLIYSKSPGFQLVNKFTPSSIMSLVSVLLEDAKIENNDQINKAFSIDYNNSLIASDEAIFWDMCDCYE